MSDQVETQIAVVKTNIEYIKKSIDTLSADMKEIKGAYVPYGVFVQAKADADKEHTTFITKDQFKPVQDRVRSLWTGAMTVISLVVLGVLGALLNLVIKK